MVRQEEPVSPPSRILHVPCFDLCILVVMGFSTPIDVPYFKTCMEQTIIKHPRFSSLLDIKDKKRYKFAWKRTKVNIDDHVFVPDVDPNMEFPDKFVEDFTAELSTKPIDFSKPLWEVYILNLKLSDATSAAVFRIHHSMGDGVSMTSLFLACGKKASDPESLPVLQTKKREAPKPKRLLQRAMRCVSSSMLVFYHTMVESHRDLATLLFLKDTNNPLRQPKLLDHTRNRYVHRIISLDDLKLIRKALNTTINDVLLGATEFAIYQYLKQQYESSGETTKKSSDFLKRSRIRFAVAVNLRDSMTVAGLSDVLEKGADLEPGKWGNIVGSWTIPLRKFDDPLDYIRDVKATMDKRKMSHSPRVQNFIMRLVMVLFGAQAAARVTRGLFSSLTVGVSNVVGPSEEIILFGHPVAYISPTARGFPLGLIMHYHSYDKKMVISMAANEELVRDPHELCDYMQKYLEHVKKIVVQSLGGKDV